jgi:hypothetical protein
MRVPTLDKMYFTPTHAPYSPVTLTPLRKYPRR